MSKKITSLLIFVFLAVSVSALPIYVSPQDGSGNLQPSTSFNYTFNFTTNADCSGVVLSNSSTITTAKDGIGFTDIDISGLAQKPNFLCEYRNNSLRKVHNFSDMILEKIWADEINVTNNITLGKKITFAFGEFIDNIVDGWIRVTSGLNVTGNIISDGNITANYFLGNGSQLTGISSTGNASWNETYANTLYYDIGNPSSFYNSTDFSISNYVPYIGATTNVNLGANNFSINTNNLFVNKENGRVGIGTTSPVGKLEVNGTMNITGGNINIENQNKMCLSTDCTKYIWYNGSNVQIVG